MEESSQASTLEWLSRTTGMGRKRPFPTDAFPFELERIDRFRSRSGRAAYRRSRMWMEKSGPDGAGPEPLDSTGSHDSRVRGGVRPVPHGSFLHSSGAPSHSGMSGASRRTALAVKDARRNRSAESAERRISKKAS